MAKRKTFLLRLSPELLKHLRAWAEQELRSLNSQIEFILREAVKKKGLQKPKGPSDQSGEDSKTKR
ncbi:MAG: type II toxin-antitoxin system antitoxin [Planctomycetota bacterium]